ncbi:MAG: alpha/beta fold hydrolase [Rhodanobacteraceae bacterium]
MRSALKSCTALLAGCTLFLALGCNAAESAQGFITVPDGARIHYLDAGQRDHGSTLLFIPGWTMDASVWQEQMHHFASAHRVVAMDPRSQGESSRTTAGNTPEQRARDLSTLIAQLKLAHVVLIGWSQGVQDVAAYVAQSGTAKLDGIVLVDAAVSSGPQIAQLHPQFTKTVLGNMAIYAAHPRNYLQGMMQAIFRKPLSTQEMQRMVDGSLRTPTDTGIAMLTMDMFAVDRRPMLAKFDKPTLIIAADSSSELADQRAEARRMPSARAVVIANAGHAVFHDQPRAFNATLEKFLAGLSQR